MANLVQKAVSNIKAKASQLLGNLDRDKSMPGFQLAQGGLGNRINQFMATPVAVPKPLYDFGKSSLDLLKKAPSSQYVMGRGQETANRIIGGYETMKKPGVLNKGMGVLQLTSGALSLTPAGQAREALVGVPLSLIKTGSQAVTGQKVTPGENLKRGVTGVETLGTSVNPLTRKAFGEQGGDIVSQGLDIANMALGLYRGGKYDPETQYLKTIGGVPDDFNIKRIRLGTEPVAKPTQFRGVEGPVFDLKGKLGDQDKKVIFRIFTDASQKKAVDLSEVEDVKSLGRKYLKGVNINRLKPEEIITDLYKHAYAPRMSRFLSEVETPKVKVQPTGKAKIKIDATPDEIISKAPEATGKRRKFTQSVLDSENVSPEVKIKVAQNESLYTQQSNKAQMNEARRAVAGDTSEALNKWISKEGKVKLTDSTKYVNEGQALIEKLDMEGRFDESADVALRMTKLGTQAGQTTQSFDNLKKLSPSGMLQYARKTINEAKAEMGDSLLDKNKVAQITDLTQDESRKIYDLMVEASKLDNTDPRKTQLVRQAIETFNQKIPVGTLDWLSTFRRENMLSNPRTHLRNVYSNLFNTFVYRPANLAGEAVVDWVGSKLTGKERQAYLSDVPVYYRNAINSMIDSSNLAMDFFKNPIEVDLANNRIPELNYLSTARMPKVMTFNTRLMQASDRLFNSMISNAEYAVQKNRGLSDSEAMDKASKLASEILYTRGLDVSNKTKQGYVATAFDGMTNGILGLRKHVPFGDWFVPFVQTPMNAVREAVLASPMGFLNIPGNINARTQVAKSLVGSTVMLAFANKAMQGEMTWSTPTDPKEKELFYASGRKPYSVRIGDTWVPMQYFGPFSLAMMIPAAANYYQNESKTAMTDDQLSKLGKIIAAIGEYTVNQTAFANVGTMAKLLSGDMDASWPSTLAFTSEQMIPQAGLLRYITTLIDPVYRDAKGKTSSEKFMNQLRKDMPFFSKTLPAYKTPTGEESVRETINHFTPYALGFHKGQYDAPLKIRQQEQQMNAIAKQAKLDAERALSGDTSAIKVMDTQDPQLRSFASYYEIDKVVRMPESSLMDKVKKEKAAYGKAIDLLDKASESGLDEGVTRQLVELMGIKYDDVKYYEVAKQDNDIKTAYITEDISKNIQNFTNRNDLLIYLADKRTKVNGDMILANGVIDNLVDEGTLTYNEGRMLKKLEIGKTPTGKKAKVKVSGRGGGAKLKVKLTPISTLLKTTRTKTKRFRISKERAKRIML